MAHRPVPLTEVDVRPADIGRFEPLIGPERMAHFRAVADRLERALGGGSVVNVNSTAVGGGVAELLQTLLAYARGAGIHARWLVVGADPDFFAITKRIHNGLYGTPGDGGDLGDAERRRYEETLEPNGEALAAALHPSVTPSSRASMARASRYPSGPLPETFSITSPSKTETRRQSSRDSTSERWTSTAGSRVTSSASAIARL